MGADRRPHRTGRRSRRRGTRRALPGHAALPAGTRARQGDRGLGRGVRRRRSRRSPARRSAHRGPGLAVGLPHVRTRRGRRPRRHPAAGPRLTARRRHPRAARPRRHPHRHGRTGRAGVRAHVGRTLRLDRPLGAGLPEHGGRAARAVPPGRAAPPRSAAAAAAVDGRAGRPGQPRHDAVGGRLGRPVLLPAALSATGPRRRAVGDRALPTPLGGGEHARLLVRPAARPPVRPARHARRGPAHPGRRTAVAVPDHGGRQLPDRPARPDPRDRARPRHRVRPAHRGRRDRRTARRLGPGQWPGQHHPADRRCRGPGRPRHARRVPHGRRRTPPLPRGGPHRGLPARLPRLGGRGRRRRRTDSLLSRRLAAQPRTEEAPAPAPTR